MITQNELCSLLWYDPDTGIFYWRVRKGRPRPWNALVGKPAGTLNDQGYIIIEIANRPYRAHRLAFLYVKGFIPKFIDHENTNRADNRWKNLRVATRSLNAANCMRHSDSASPYKGVFKKKGKWGAKICINYKQIYLGSFETPELAAAAYIEKAQSIFGEFARAS